MAKDKEFSKNRLDKGFGEEKKTDRHLGHHTEVPTSEHPSSSHKVRKFQSFQEQGKEFETKTSSPDVATEEKSEPYSVGENQQQEETQEEFMKNSESFSESAKPFDTNTSQPKSTPQKNHYYRRHHQKTDVPVADSSIYDKDNDFHTEQRSDGNESKAEAEPKTDNNSGSHSPRKDDFEFSSDGKKSDSFGKKDYEFTSGTDDKGEKKSDGKEHKEKVKKKSTYDNAKDSDTSSSASGTGEKADALKGSSKEFSKYEKAQAKADKAKEKFQKAQDNLPHKKKLKKKRVFDGEKQKSKNKLVFEKEVKKQPESSRLQFAEKPISFFGYEASNKIHSKISSVEKDNSAVEATHKVESAVENFSLQTAPEAAGP